MSADNSWSLCGAWEGVSDKSVSVTVEKMRLIVQMGTAREVWDVVEGRSLIGGLKVRRGEEVLEASSMVKFNEMILRVGPRHWCLRKKGEGPMVFPPGFTPNLPMEAPRSDGTPYVPGT